MPRYKPLTDNQRKYYESEKNRIVTSIRLDEKYLTMINDYLENGNLISTPEEDKIFWDNYNNNILPSLLKDKQTSLDRTNEERRVNNLPPLTLEQMESVKYRLTGLV